MGVVELLAILEAGSTLLKTDMLPPCALLERELQPCLSRLTRLRDIMECL